MIQLITILIQAKLRKKQCRIETKTKAPTTVILGDSILKKV